MRKENEHAASSPQNNRDKKKHVLGTFAIWLSLKHNIYVIH